MGITFPYVYLALLLPEYCKIYMNLKTPDVTCTIIQNGLI